MKNIMLILVSIILASVIGCGVSTKKDSQVTVHRSVANIGNEDFEHKAQIQKLGTATEQSMWKGDYYSATFESFPIEGGEENCKKMKQYFTFLFAPNWDYFSCEKDVMWINIKYLTGSFVSQGYFQENDRDVCPKIVSKLNFKKIDERNFVEFSCTDDNMYMKMDVRISP